MNQTCQEDETTQVFVELSYRDVQANLACQANNPC